MERLGFKMLALRGVIHFKLWLVVDFMYWNSRVLVAMTTK